MWVRCKDCNRGYNDEECWTICPHSPLGFPIKDLCPMCDTLKSVHGPCRHQQEEAQRLLSPNSEDSNVEGK